MIGTWRDRINVMSQHKMCCTKVGNTNLYRRRETSTLSFRGSEIGLSDLFMVSARWKLPIWCIQQGSESRHAQTTQQTHHNIIFSKQYTQAHTPRPFRLATHFPLNSTQINFHIEVRRSGGSEAIGRLVEVLLSSCPFPTNQTPWGWGQDSLSNSVFYRPILWDGT